MLWKSQMMDLQLSKNNFLKMSNAFILECYKTNLQLEEESQMKNEKPYESNYKTK